MRLHSRCASAFNDVGWVTVRWIPTGECLGDIFTKNTIEAEQFFRLWHTLCGYKSWSVLEEITTKAAAIAIVVVSGG